MSDYGKLVPATVLQTAASALDRAKHIKRTMDLAMETYAGPEYQRVKDSAREVDIDNLRSQAKAIVNWAIAVRRALPAVQLCEIISSSAVQGDGGLHVPIVRTEIDLRISDSFNGGQLATELELELNANRRLFRHHEWYVGFRVVRDGQLHSAHDLCSTLHPETLRQVHSAIASGKVWNNIRNGLDRLVDGFKDR
jgi:hypothetical protein